LDEKSPNERKILMFTPLKDKVALVTGGSKGIGKGIATVFARAGIKVMIVARGEETAALTVGEIRASGGVADYFIGNVSNKADMEAAAAKTVAVFGGIDIVCANAGTAAVAKIDEMSEDQWDRVLDINLKGMFFTIKSCLPELKKSETPRIILTSSVTGAFTGYPGWTHYGASKAGMLGYMRSASVELAKYQITVNAVLPGNVSTEGLSNMPEAYIASATAAVPLKRLGAVEDIGNTALFLATKEAGYITGQSIVVDGGQILPETFEAIDC
jgi:3-oxoacyl-[acyl-carrier protein] reductase